MSSLHREDLAKLATPPDGCVCNAPPKMYAPCHLSHRLFAEFDVETGDLVLSCGICRAHVARVAVAESPARMLNTAEELPF